MNKLCLLPQAKGSQVEPPCFTEQCGRDVINSENTNLEAGLVLQMGHWLIGSYTFYLKNLYMCVHTHTQDMYVYVKSIYLT